MIKQVTLTLMYFSFVIACPVGLFGQDTTNPPSGDLFNLLDRNGDGDLDPFEALDVLKEIESELDDGELTAKRIRELLDQNEQDEFEEIEEMLEDLDANQDGSTSLDELDEEMLEFAKLLDRNEDGIITATEASQADLDEEMMMTGEEIQEEVDQIFEELDENQDGTLTEDESPEPEFWQELLEGDSNGDGELSSTEIISFLKADNLPASFMIEGDTAVMSGVINGDTPARVLRLVYEHPDVRTIQMVNVPGSIDDESNLRAARYVRQFGFTTVLRKNDRVASGGTDFFLAGKKRIFEDGASFGIHSWGGPGFQGKDVPKDDPQHRLYLDYYEEMGIPATFYWRTLDAASASDIHWMTASELKEFCFRCDDPADSGADETPDPIESRSPKKQQPEADRLESGSSK